MSMTTVEIARLIRDFMEQRSHVLKSVTQTKLDKYIKSYEDEVKYNKLIARSEEQRQIGALLDHIYEEIRQDAFDDYECDRAMEDYW